MYVYIYIYICIYSIHLFSYNDNYDLDTLFDKIGIQFKEKNFNR